MCLCTLRVQIYFLLLFPHVFESLCECVHLCQLLQVVLGMKFNLKDIPWTLEYTESYAELSVVFMYSKHTYSRET